MPPEKVYAQRAIDRRQLLVAAARGAALAGLTAQWPALAAGAPVVPTLECRDGDGPTRRSTAGPFFTPDSPLRSVLRDAETGGQPVTLSGIVHDTRCAHVPKAQIELWHADENGDYDNKGYRCRGHVFSDAQGRFQFATIRPGHYPGRTIHYHIRVQPPGGAVLTTQLYFPGERRNDRDGLFHSSLLLATQEHAGELFASFGFVVAA